MATWLSGISKQHRLIRKNTFLWVGVFLLFFAVVICRLGWLMIGQSAHYRQVANRQYQRTYVLRAERGKLFDRNLSILALDDVKHILYADPALIPYPEFMADALAPVLKMPKADLLDDFTHRRIATGISGQAAELIRQQNFPGITVTPLGARLRIGFAHGASPTPSQVKKLAARLNIPIADIKQVLAAATSTGTRWLPEPFPADGRDGIAQLAIAGLQMEGFTSYRVDADQRLYTGDSPTVSSHVIAMQLAPLLEMKQKTVEERLSSPVRYVVVCPDLSPEAVQTLQRMQATIFVTQPGRLSDAPREKDDNGDPLESAVTRLDSMVNPQPRRHAGKLEPAPPPLISQDSIRQHLLAGAEPGPLVVKADDKGQPIVGIHYRLTAKPIPGVMYGLPGMAIKQEMHRQYPYGTLASAALGWVKDADEHPHGVFGLEAMLDARVKGRDGEEKKEIYGRQQTIPEHSSRVEPVNGRDVKLTLDLTIQQAADEELAKAVRESKALRGQCIVLDPKTGEILAMATYPNWDANAPGKSTVPMVNPAISNFYEPGSTFKVVAVTAALEEGLYRDGQIITNCTGALTVGRRTVHEAHHAHGQVDYGELLEQSCNIGAATLALQLGSTRFLKWCDTFGFGAKTGVELAQESPGSLNRANAASAKITLANMGFGQSLAVTPLQMAAAYGVFANGGEWIEPHLVKSYEQPDGSWKDAPPVPHRRVCTQATAALMRKYLERVVVKGTGNLAAIKGYRVGGKTGTAQKPPYSARKYIGSFIGVMPIDDPKLVVIAVIDEPGTSIYGGVVAGPVISRVGLRALQYLNIPPSATATAKPTN